MGPPSGTSVHGISQARIQDWVAIPSSRGSSPHRDRIQVSCLAAAAAKSLQSCLTLCDPIDGSPPGSPVPGILQARTLKFHFLLQCIKAKSESEVAQSCQTLSDPTDRSLSGSSVHGIVQARIQEWVAIRSSRGSSGPRD